MGEHASANGHAAKRWEQRAMALLSALVSGLSLWMWDMRQEVSMILTRQNERTHLVQQIPALHKELEAVQQEAAQRKGAIDLVPILDTLGQHHAVRQAELSKDLMLLREMVQARFETLRLESLAMRAELRALRTPQRVFEEEGP